VAARVVNLTFHGTGTCSRALDPGEEDVWLGADEVASVLDAAAGRDDVRITFDDGNASDVEHALPALRDRGLHATFFVVAGRLGAPGFLDAGALHELAAAGMPVGCHGMAHRAWRGLDGAALEEELVAAKGALEDVLGGPVSEAACPFGSYDRQVLARLRRAGYQRVYTSDRGTTRADAWLQPRNTLQRGRGTAPLVEAVAPDRPAAALQRRAKLTAKRWR
jgi:peptidoglycan/xylan/chitin deacetylase (PgdA/CDA1 family)